MNVGSPLVIHKSDTLDHIAGPDISVSRFWHCYLKLHNAQPL